MNTLKTIISNSDFVSTSFYGDTIRTNCVTLQNLFGSYYRSDPYKINYEWNLLIKEDGIPFAIYDWKEPNLDIRTITDYHIAARNIKESRIVKDLVDMYLKNNN